MSIFAEAVTPCSRCGRKEKITVYKSINVAENPDLREKIKDGSLFIWECPDCGQKNLVRYETLYHDPSRRIMIWLIPSGDFSESQMQAISNHARAIGNYTLRRVSDTGSLMEKILILEAGLNDAAIEMCKYVTKMEIRNNGSGKPENRPLLSAPLHFFRIDGEEGNRFLVFMYPEEGEMRTLNIGFNVYEDCCGIIGRNPDIIPEGSFLKIDGEWLDSVMK